MFSFQEALDLPMVVNNLYSLCATVFPLEDDAPPFVDSNAVISLQVP